MRICWRMHQPCWNQDTLRSTGSFVRPPSIPPPLCSSWTCPSDLLVWFPVLRVLLHFHCQALVAVGGNPMQSDCMTSAKGSKRDRWAIQLSVIFVSRACRTDKASVRKTYLLAGVHCSLCPFPLSPLIFLSTAALSVHYFVSFHY